MKRAYLPEGIIATNKYEIKDNAEAFFNLGANYKDRDKEIDQLKAENESIRSQLLAQCKISSELLDEKGQLLLLHEENFRLKEDLKKAIEQIEKMKCRENCGNDFEINNSTSCPLYDFQNVRCPCDNGR